MFPLEASLSGAQTPRLEVSPGDSPPCSFAASPVGWHLLGVVWAVAGGGAAAHAGLRHPRPRHRHTARRRGSACLQWSALLGSSLPVPGLPTPAGALWKALCPAQGHGTHLLPLLSSSPAQSPSFCLSARWLGWGSEEGTAWTGSGSSFQAHSKYGQPVATASHLPGQTKPPKQPSCPPRGSCCPSHGSNSLSTKSRGRYPGPPQWTAADYPCQPRGCWELFLPKNSAGSAVGKTLRLVVARWAWARTKWTPVSQGL